MANVRWTTRRDAQQQANDGRFAGGTEAFRQRIADVAFVQGLSITRALCRMVENGEDTEGFVPEPIDWLEEG